MEFSTLLDLLSHFHRQHLLWWWAFLTRLLTMRKSMCHCWHQHLRSLRSSFRGWDTEEKPVVRDGFCSGHGSSRTSLQLCWSWQRGAVLNCSWESWVSWAWCCCDSGDWPGQSMDHRCLCKKAGNMLLTPLHQGEKLRGAEAKHAEKCHSRHLLQHGRGRAR